MNLFFLSILIIAAGGILPLLSFRQFTLMKILGVLGIGAGSFLGMLDALSRLSHDGSTGVSIAYLNTLALSFQIDGLSAFFLLAIFAVCLLAAIYSFHYMNDSGKALRTATSYFFFSLLAASMALVVVAANMITFMLSWEIMSLSSFFLVIYDHQKPENRKAGYLYFVFSHVGAMFIFTAFGVLYGQTGSFGFDSAGLSTTAKMLVFVLAFVGFGSKAGVFPFHVWLPHAHPAAPSHISAVMSGVMIKTGIYGILRMYSILDLHTPALGTMVLVFGMVSGILGVVYALGQHDIKRLLAYHSVENIGIILIGIGIGMIGVEAKNPIMAVLGFSGGLLHVLNHAIFKSLLFMGAGMVLHKTGTRSIDALGGLLKNMKITGVTFLIGSLAIAGLPPFNGFVSEFFIYMGSFRGIAVESPVFVLSLLAIVSLAVIGGLALACFTKVVGVVFQGEPRSQSARDVDEKGPAMLAAHGDPGRRLRGHRDLSRRLHVHGTSRAWLPWAWTTDASPWNPLPGCRPTSPSGRPLFLAAMLLLLALRRTGVPGKTHRSQRHLGLRVYPAHRADAVYRIFLCRIDPGIFQTGGPAGGNPPPRERPVSKGNPLSQPHP